MTDLIVDANSLYAIAWYGCKQKPWETVVRCVNDAVSLVDPEKMKEPVGRTLFCWDGGQKKAKERAERPPEYEGTKPQVKRALEALLGTQNVRLEGYEADDVIATAAFASTAEHVVVASGDKDLHQLQGGNISYFSLNQHCYVGFREILSKWHVKRPSQVAIALAIQGDIVDKIPGIKGWGKKKVEQLFEAVKADMNFPRALQVIEGQIPPDKMKEFYDALELTLLNTGVPDVPEPVPLVFGGAQAIRDLGLDECGRFYTKVAGRY